MPEDAAAGPAGAARPTTVGFDDDDNTFAIAMSLTLEHGRLLIGGDAGAGVDDRAIGEFASRWGR